MQPTWPWSPSWGGLGGFLSGSRTPPAAHPCQPIQPTCPPHKLLHMEQDQITGKPSPLLPIKKQKPSSRSDLL